MKLLPKLTLAAALAVALLVTTGCNTVKGLGEDFETMGEKMQNTGN